MSKKVVVIGIEGLNPDLVDLWSDELTNISKLQAAGVWGRIKSSIPTLSPVSWTCVQTGQNPGAYGFWDYKFKDDISYTNTNDVNSKTIQTESLYQYLTRRARKVAIVGFPVTSPPPKVHGGFAVSCFMHQDAAEPYTWPKKFAGELEEQVGTYLFDVITPGDSLGSIDKEQLLEKAKLMDEQRFKTVELLYTTKFCDIIFAVCMGADRVTKVFYPDFDKHHKGFSEDSKYKNAVKDYYLFLDQKIGEIKSLIDEKTILLVLSNQGAQSIYGSVNLNEWLLKEGYLAVHNVPSTPLSLSALEVDWSKTKTWSAGNAGQIFLNLKGREGQGIVESSDCENLINEISGKLEKFAEAESLQASIFKGKDLYTGAYAAYAPDMVVMFNNGSWASSEKVGHGSILLTHEQASLYYGGNGLEGYYSITGPEIPASGKNEASAYLVDIAPTILYQINEEIPQNMEGSSIIKIDEDEIEKRVMARLKSMGY